jgi:hypothetical protein
MGKKSFFYRRISFSPHLGEKRSAIMFKNPVFNIVLFSVVGTFFAWSWVIEPTFSHDQFATTLIALILAFSACSVVGWAGVFHQRAVSSASIEQHLSSREGRAR